MGSLEQPQLDSRQQAVGEERRAGARGEERRGLGFLFLGRLVRYEPERSRENYTRRD